MTDVIRKRRKEARPEEILAAAIAVLGEVGFANARMADIAKRAGIAKGTIYLYFKTKDELFQGVVQHYLGPTLGRLDDLKTNFEGTAAELVAMAIRHAYRELVGSWERRTIMRILISEGARFPQLTSYYHREVISRGILMVKTLLERGVAQGEFREEVLSINPAVVMGPMIMASVWKMIFDEVSPLDVEEYARGHVEIVMRGVMKA